MVGGKEDRPIEPIKSDRPGTAEENLVIREDTLLSNPAVSKLSSLESSPCIEDITGRVGIRLSIDVFNSVNFAEASLSLSLPAATIVSISACLALMSVTVLLVSICPAIIILYIGAL
jgi:hypothetical protein